MLHYLLVFAFFFSSAGLMAQDERYFRKMLAGDLIKPQKVFDPVPNFMVSGPAYLIDLDGDGIEERLVAQKRNGVDWFEIQNSSHMPLFSTKLSATGSESHLFRIKIVHINPKVKVLILFFDEGKTEGHKMESYGIVHFLSYEENDLKTLSFQKGTRFYHEFKGQRDQYFRRAHVVNIYDIDGDGEREIVVEYRHTQRIFKYVGQGSWKIF